MAWAAATASAVPLMRTCTGSSACSLASTRAPVFSRMSLMVAPPFPMTRPMTLFGSFTISTFSGLWKPRAIQPEESCCEASASRRES
eukprot:CAMPEP_0175460714 /NCGR_PEP_ID=MMETSP0095-20121207/67786_1 /TAXON_ID=311494 /ORGANISM="Alexandrium monilatum, Strain CCMP3105" /LENGTH=86 /DNA_ID=CAMNT_0016761743 /DNA_START=121 /DNA_END=381 /DNA_ORIENTATION=+